MKHDVVVRQVATPVGRQTIETKCRVWSSPSVGNVSCETNKFPNTGIAALLRVELSMFLLAFCLLLLLLVAYVRCQYRWVVV